MINRSIRAAATSISSIILVACAQPAYIPEDVAAPPLPEDDYRSAALRGESVYRIDPARSRVFIQVGRGGAMKTAGHDHLIVSEDVEGLVLVSDDPTASRAHLRIPLQRLIVDRPAYRQRFGLKADISESSINGTTRNMQEKVLASSLYPWAEIQVKFASAYDEPPSMSVAITLHGTAFDYIVPVDLRVEPEQLSASGSVAVQHSDFALTPYTAAGGLLRVADQIDITFELTALRWSGLN